MAVARYLLVPAFAVPFAIFTYLLLVPHPPQPKVPEPWMTFVINKATHAGGFAYLTAVAYWLFRDTPGRRAAVVFMLLHAVGTEIGQTFTRRHGCVQDVLIDWAGVAVGVVAARRISRLLRPEISSPQDPTGSRSAAAGPE